MTVNTNPTSILPGGAQGGSWLIQNVGEETIYVGRTSASASTAAGIQIGEGQAVSIDLGTVTGSTLYAATETGTSTVRVLRTR